jgi:hypothetical protein
MQPVLGRASVSFGDTDFQLSRPPLRESRSSLRSYARNCREQGYRTPNEFAEAFFFIL